MTVLFQDKIIYMSYIGRKEKLENYTAVCRPVVWQHLHIKSLDGTRIALCIGRNTCNDEIVDKSQVAKNKKKVVICYFQGNGSSTPPRLPLLSNTLKAVEAQATAQALDNIEFVVVALSYRGYWTSSGRASQKGIEKDAQAMLVWVRRTLSEPDTDLEIILWGQSIGAGVATVAAASYIAQNEHSPKITGLILETPFTGIKSMLLALYPQKWLPYQYLYPFLWNHWDSETALRSIGRSQYPPRVLIMPATRDEVVPPSEANKLEQVSREAGLKTQRTNIIGALHTEATTRREGQAAVANFIVDVVNRA